MRATPIRHRVEVVRERSVAEKLGLFVLGALREGEGVVCDGAAAEEEDAVAYVSAELGIAAGSGGWVWDGAKEAAGGGGRGFEGVGAAEVGLQRASEVVESEHLGIELGFAKVLAF